MIRVITKTFEKEFWIRKHETEEKEDMRLKSCINSIDSNIKAYIKAIETFVSRNESIKLKDIDIKPLYTKNSNAIIVMLIAKFDDHTLNHDKDLKLEIDDYYYFGINY